MPPAKTQKASRNIPAHIQRAVNSRDNSRCQNCGVVTEFIHYDHIFPFDLGGPTTVENIQSLCPKCNTSKGNSIQCHHCRHWMSPNHTKCPQCGARFRYSKRANTLAGKIELLSERIGRAVLIGGAALVLLAVLAGGIFVARAVRGGDDSSEQSANIQQVVNTSFDVPAGQPASFQVVVPPGARNARVVGGYKVTSGSKVNLYILDAAQRQQAARENLNSARLRQVLAPGTYVLQFSSVGGTPVRVAAEFYLKYD